MLGVLPLIQNGKKYQDSLQEMVSNLNLKLSTFNSTKVVGVNHPNDNACLQFQPQDNSLDWVMNLRLEILFAFFIFGESYIFKISTLILVPNGPTSKVPYRSKYNGTQKVVPSMLIPTMFQGTWARACSCINSIWDPEGLILKLMMRWPKTHI